MSWDKDWRTNEEKIKESVIILAEFLDYHKYYLTNEPLGTIYKDLYIKLVKYEYDLLSITQKLIFEYFINDINITDGYPIQYYRAWNILKKACKDITTYGYIRV